MMDLKEIIKWFIPCFHILQVLLKAKDLRLTFICLFLLLNFRVGCAANVNGVVTSDTKNVHSLVYDNFNGNQSDVSSDEKQSREFPATDGSVGRTFGRPFKKMMTAMLPLVFQIGAASTWAVVAAIVGVKTLFVTLVILKILLIAGAAKTLAVIDNNETNDKRRPGENPAWYRYGAMANNSTNGTKVESVGPWHVQKVGALFGSKGHGHYSQGWEPPHHSPQKEIHLHIHNGHPEGHEEHVGYGAPGPWSREDPASAIELIKHNAIDPYSIAGPQTIKTPFGNYVKVESNNQSQLRPIQVKENKKLHQKPL